MEEGKRNSLTEIMAPTRRRNRERLLRRSDTTIVWEPARHLLDVFLVLLPSTNYKTLPPFLLALESFEHCPIV